MPRRSRIDAAGALHHIIVRGIDRQKIFRDDKDRDKFLERLGTLLVEARTSCFAWALIPNHFHLLLRTGSVPVATVMRRLLTGHAVYFNRRYNRSGHLFQNRYKSILCQEDVYLLELVRYIHLNPLRAGLVRGHDQLSGYPYSGHSSLMGKKIRVWQDIDYILRMFSSKLSLARRRYNGFVRDGIAMGRRNDLTGGGLIRSQGGWSAVKELRKARVFQKGDERILGDGDFVDEVLRESEERLDRQALVKSRGMDFDKVVERVSHYLGISVDEVLAGGKRRQAVLARSLLCFWGVNELGLSQVWLSRRLGVSQSTVSEAVARGKKLAKEKRFLLLD